MVVQAKVGLALLGLGLFGLWYVNKKEKEQGGEDTVDTDFEEVKPGTSSFLPSSSSSLRPSSALQTNTDSAQADGTNSLVQNYLSEPKSNLVVTDYMPTPTKKPYPNCAIVSGLRLNVNRQGIGSLPVLL